MKGKDDKPMSHDIKNATITVDGNKAKAEDLKEGMEITVTIDEKDVVTKVDAKKAAEPPKAPDIKKGKFSKLDGTKLTIKDDDGKEHPYDIKDAKITRDGKADAKADELKADDEITVTIEDGKVTKVDAKPKK
jgi:ribosomal 50S subunit-recycling heat shock protein